MPHSDLISLLRSEPFRPFRIHTAAGAAFDIGDPRQVGASPGGRLFIAVLSDGHFEVLTPELIQRCEVISTATPPIPAAPPAATSFLTKPNKGRVAISAATERDGRRLAHIAVSADKRTVILSTAGTRWDLSGLETFDNGRTLYLHHADDPSLHKRVIVWPPETATFESFAEAAPASELERQLRELDIEARAAPKNPPGPPASYFKSTKPPPGYEPPMPPTTGRESGPAPDDPNRFEFRGDLYEAGANMWCNCPTLIDTLTGTVMFDLSNTNWDATPKRDGDYWIFELRHYPDPNHSLTMVIDPKVALVHFGGPLIPLHIAARHLINYTLYRSWDGLLHVFSTELPIDEPHITISAAGCSIELWPGAGSIKPPFLTMRIVGPSGRAILDLRGTLWGAYLELNDPSLIRFSLIHTDEKTRYAFRPRLIIEPTSQRITSDTLPGCTTLAAFAEAARTCRTPEWLLEDLTALFARGLEIPLP